MDRQTALIARRFARALRKRMHVRLLLLYGSRARGDHFVTSDFDFVLVSDAFSHVPFVRRMSGLYEYWQSDHDLQALCYTPGEWERLRGKRGILLNAQREGVRLI